MLMQIGNSEQGTDAGLSMDEAVQRLLAVEEPVEGQPETEEVEQPSEETSEASEQDAEEETQQEGDDEEVKPAPKKYTVKVDGKELEVDEDELLSGYQRTADYTRKTTALAEQRKALEAEAQAIAKEREFYQSQLKDVLTQAVALKQQEPDWTKLAQDDPIGYVQQRAAWDAQQSQLRQAYEAYQRIEQQQAAEQEKARAEYLKEQSERLIDMIPEWKDTGKATAEKQAVAKYLLDQGYSQDDVAQVSDATAITLARKAMLYDKMMAGKPEVQKRVAEAPKSLPAGAARGNVAGERAKQLETQFKKSGKLDDAVALLMARQKGR